MKSILTRISAVAYIIILSACSTLDYHPYDTLIKGETNLTAKNINLIERQLNQKESLKFAVISDTQRWYDETKQSVEALNRMSDIDFVIHCGDQSDFGLTDEFVLMRDILNKLKMPWITIIGNHDYLGTGEFCYYKIYGAGNFAFTAGNTRFLCLNTNSLEDSSQPDLNFLEKELEYVKTNSAIKNTIAIMHIKPFCIEFNNQIADKFHNHLKEFPNLLCCINGHNHILEQCDIFNDGTIYYGTPSIDEKIIIIFTVTEQELKYETVKF